MQISKPTDSNNGQGAKIGVIIATLGLNDCLYETLTSVAKQKNHVTSVVVVDQSKESRIAEICRTWSKQLPVIHVRTHTGLSHARNVGIAHLDSSVEIVAFTDDDCTYAADCFEYALKHFQNQKVGAVTGRLRSDTPRLKFGHETTLLNRRTVWTKAIEPAMFYRHSVVREIGSFNESLGIGCRTPWQSGEGTDLLLRTLAAGHQIVYTPMCEVYEHDSGRGPKLASHAKSRKYGRGTGRVYRMHYSWPACLTQVARPLAGAFLSILQGDSATFMKRMQAAIGRWEGMTGRLHTKILK